MFVYISEIEKGLSHEIKSTSCMDAHRALGKWLLVQPRFGANVRSGARFLFIENIFSAGKNQVPCLHGHLANVVVQVKDK